MAGSLAGAAWAPEDNELRNNVLGQARAHLARVIQVEEGRIGSGVRGSALEKSLIFTCDERYGWVGLVAGTHPADENSRTPAICRNWAFFLGQLHQSRKATEDEWFTDDDRGSILLVGFEYLHAKITSVISGCSGAGRLLRRNYYRSEMSAGFFRSLGFEDDVARLFALQLKPSPSMRT